MKPPKFHVGHDPLASIRSRWRRWLGQQFSAKMGFGIELLDANRKSWPVKVLGREATEDESGYDYWKAAINQASAGQLGRLDIINIDN